MTFSLSSIATALTVVSGAVQASEVIYKAGAELIVVAENAYDASIGSGSTKKAAVIAALKEFATSLGENWDAIHEEISAWIDVVIQSYNKLKALVTPVAGSNTTATVITPAASEAAAV